MSVSWVAHEVGAPLLSCGVVSYAGPQGHFWEVDSTLWILGMVGKWGGDLTTVLPTESGSLHVSRASFERFSEALGKH